VEEGDAVTMTCVLRNDGWADIAAAHLTVTLPAELEIVAGSSSAGLTYDPAARTLRWHGPVAQNQTVTHGFRVNVTDTLADSTYISLPARLSYDDHSIAFDLPYILRVNAPDLSLSTLEAGSTASLPDRLVAYTMTVRNTGVSAAVAVMTTTVPSHTTFVDPMYTGGVGTWQVVSDALFWTGPVAAGNEVVLSYQLELDSVGDYILRHVAHVSDQYGERWSTETRVTIWTYKTFFPIMYR
jgi:uncharacterized repeat protein (TIGR01451 family)